jgi:acyl-CoA thioesterase-1
MNGRYGAPGRRVQLADVLLALILLGWTALAAAMPAPAPAIAAAPARVVLVMGDSLSAGYGLAANQGWASLAAQRLRATHPAWRLVNASVSGETTAGGAARIGRELQRLHPAVVVIELGANDGLRGLDLGRSRANLDRMIADSRSAGARVLLVGMHLPPNFGPQYTRGFDAMYQGLARAHRVAFLPFLLAPIAADRRNFQADNLHPVAAVQGQLRDHVWAALAPLLD